MTDISGNTPIYVNFDIETTGAHPDHSAILSIGAVAISSRRVRSDLKEFSINFEIPSNRFWDESTREWWKEHPEALAACSTNAKNPRAAMKAFVLWLFSLMDMTPDGNPIVFVASPAAFDFPLLRSYANEYEGAMWNAICTQSGNNDAVRCLDLPTLAMAVMGTEYPMSGRKNWPAEWTDGFAHTHESLSDARLQANAFKKMMMALGKEMQ